MSTAQNPNADREIRLNRTLKAPLSLVWEVWTNPDHIKNWWGPNGFNNTITKMEMRTGGTWELVMHGPDGTDYPGKHQFLEVVPMKKVVYRHEGYPSFTSTITFEADGDKTRIDWHMLFESREQFIEVVKKFKADDGLRQNVAKLEHYVKAQQQLRNELKTGKTARTTTYLNFPGNTEEAMHFYKTVFETEFVSGTLQRFGDLPAAEGMPPLSDEDKKLILHAELPITGNHLLMATDAPESMGFTVTRGNNMHINIEPETRAEAERIFNALSAGGQITMPLQDMFWGAYFGSFTDKYGINWMINYRETAASH
jgi:uncharacterized glyoxalase superfamily protein PhnB/uncharacterized protein YndB with AHSA1/START domain